MNFGNERKRSEALNELHRSFGDEDAKQMQADYKALLQQPAFRRILVSILKRARVFGSISYDSVETNTVMKAIGFRELGVDIYMAANMADGAMVLKAIQERNEIERDRKARIEILVNQETKGN